MKNRLKNLAALAAVTIIGAVLPSCSHDDDGPSARQKKGEVRITAYVGELNSRATEANWEANDQIAVSNDKGVSNKPYTTTAGDGNFAADDGKTIVIEGSDSVTFTAFYPYTSTINENTTKVPVSVTESSSDTYTSDPGKVDMMAADAVTANAVDPDVAFKFTHRMTRIALKFQDTSPDSLKLDPNKCLITYSIEGAATDGEFDVKTGVVTANAGSTNKKVTVDGVRLEQVSPVFLPPTATSNNTPLTIKVSVKKNGASQAPGSRADDPVANYTATVTPQLLADHQYNFTLTFKYGDQMVVSSSTISGMSSDGGSTINMTGGGSGSGNSGDNGGGTGTGGGTGSNPGGGSASSAQVGDYLLSDGTILSKTTDLSADPALKARVRAVVYYVPADQAARDLLTANKYPYNNGLAIAINPVDVSTFTDDPSEDGAFFSSKNGTVSLQAAAANFPQWIVPQSEGDNGTFEYLGYNNTQLWIAISQDANTQWKNAGDNVKKAVDVYTSASAFDSGANVSSWYLPCMKETEDITANITELNNSITAAGGNLQSFPYGSPTSGCYYWTSDGYNTEKEYISTLNAQVLSPNYAYRNTKGASDSSAYRRGWFQLSVAF